MADAKPKALKFTTPEFRGSYVNLVKPKRIAEDPNSPEKYSILIPLPKADKAAAAFVAKLKSEMLAAAKAKFGKDVPEKALKHWPIRDGDEMDQEGFAGHWCISASNKFKPGAIDTRGQKLIAEDDLYSGAWYRASLSVWAWSHKVGGKGVSINLNNVLKVKDDDKIGGGSKAEEDFADLIDEGAADEAPTDTEDGGEGGEDLLGD